MIEGQTIQWSKDRQYNDRRTDNTMIEGQTIQWSKAKDKTMIYKTVFKNKAQIREVGTTETAIYEPHLKSIEQYSGCWSSLQ
jgi:hypothetical protein